MGSLPPPSCVTSFMMILWSASTVEAFKEQGFPVVNFFAGGILIPEESIIKMVHSSPVVECSIIEVIVPLQDTVISKNIFILVKLDQLF